MAMIDVSGLPPGQSHRNQPIFKPSRLVWIQHRAKSLRADPAA